MPNASPLFADRILHIAVTGPLARIELGALAAPAHQDEKPQLTPTQTLIMPLEGLLASKSMLDAIVKQLVADGVLKLQGAETSEPAA